MLKWWSELDASAKGLLTLGAFAGVVASATKGCDRVASTAQLRDAFARQEIVDARQDEDLELLFQTQVRVVTGLESLKEEVREVRKDLRAIDAGRPLPPLRVTEPAPAPEPEEP